MLFFLLFLNISCILYTIPFYFLKHVEYTDIEKHEKSPTYIYIYIILSQFNDCEYISCKFFSRLNMAYIVHCENM